MVSHYQRVLPPSKSSKSSKSAFFKVFAVLCGDVAVVGLPCRGEFFRDAKWRSNDGFYMENHRKSRGKPEENVGFMGFYGILPAMTKITG